MTCLLGILNGTGRCEDRCFLSVCKLKSDFIRKMNVLGGDFHWNKKKEFSLKLINNVGLHFHKAVRKSKKYSWFSGICLGFGVGVDIVKLCWL